MLLARLKIHVDTFKSNSATTSFANIARKKTCWWLLPNEFANNFGPVFRSCSEFV